MTPTLNYLQLRQFHRLNLNFSSITIEEGGAMSQFRSLAERSLFRPVAGTCSNFLVINLQFYSPAFIVNFLAYCLLPIA